MFAVDTNILIHAAEQNFPEHERARSVLNEWRGRSAAWYVTWNVVYEFIRVITHPRVFRRPWSSTEPT